MQRSRLPINITTLLGGKVVESDRLELKSGWNPTPILRTICAFANDFENLGGGYIVIGIEEENGRPILPPKGLDAATIDLVQRDLQRICRMLQPNYYPILSIEEVADRQVVVLWCPGGLYRPYQAPQDCQPSQKHYESYIRRYSSTVKAQGAQLAELMSLASQVPFDDRINQAAEPEDLRIDLILPFLREVKSNLAETATQLPFRELCRQMSLVEGGDEFLRPRNVGLLFFSDVPSRYFPVTQIDVVHFPDGPGGDSFTEKTFKGPLATMVREALRYIQSMFISEVVVKRSHKAEADRAWTYPYAAIEEAVVNAVFHRGYDVREPVEVRVEPDRLIVLSYPGPVSSVSQKDLDAGRVVPRRYRNRRIGEFLKELSLAEGRGTGMGKILREAERNGSPRPRFETDEDRTYFLVEFPIHLLVHEVAHSGAHDGVQDGAHDEAHDEQLTETATKIINQLEAHDHTRAELQACLKLGSRSSSLKNALNTLLDLGLIEMMLPDKPTSKNQRYRLTDKGRRRR